MNSATNHCETAGNLPLTDRVRAVIRQRAGLRCAQIRIVEQEGAIVLEGHVSFYHDRQVALACTTHVPGVRRVIDRIRVTEPLRHSERSSAEMRAAAAEERRNAAERAGTEE